MTTHDVLVVGGGPAGSSCARALVRAGLDVCVVDRATFPRDKVCAGWLTPQVIESLELDVRTYAAEHVLQAVTGFEVGVIGGLAARCEYGRPVSWFIRRCEFDDFLLRRSGAHMRLGEPVEAVERRGATWCINGELRARMVVGAGGHACPIAQLVGGGPRSERPIAAQEVEFLLDSDLRNAYDGDPPKLLFCPDLLGYGWCVRKGDYLNVGLGRLDGHGLTAHVRHLWRYLAARDWVPHEPPGRMRGHAYLPRPASRRELVADGALLVGDAAGLADPHSGEGIRQAVESGLLAAATIVAAREEYSTPRLEPYREALLARYGRAAARIDTSPRSAWQLMASRALLGRRTFVRRVVLDRWFLHRRLPGLRPGAELTSSA